MTEKGLEEAQQPAIEPDAARELEVTQARDGRRPREGRHGREATNGRGHRSAVFVDKDGTLIEDLPYNVDPARVRLAPGARSGIAEFGRAGLPLVVITNQSGVARGYFTEADLEALHRHLAGVIGEAGAELLGFYACPHLPEGINEFAVECDCRKPLPGLIHRAAEDLAIEPARSWFIGDTWMDVVAGRSAGCRTILVGPDVRTIPELPPERRPDHTARDFLGAARLVLAELAVVR